MWMRWLMLLARRVFKLALLPMSIRIQRQEASALWRKSMGARAVNVSPSTLPTCLDHRQKSRCNPLPERVNDVIKALLFVLHFVFDVNKQVHRLCRLELPIIAGHAALLSSPPPQPMMSLMLILLLSIQSRYHNLRRKKLHTV